MDYERELRTSHNSVAQPQHLLALDVPRSSLMFSGGSLLELSCGIELEPPGELPNDEPSRLDIGIPSWGSQ